MIFIIDDDEIMAECVAQATGRETKIFASAIEAMQALDERLSEMIFLDILLDGPDGFTFLNELVSYDDTAVVPVVIVTSLDIAGRDLADYGVVGVLSKETMRPVVVWGYVLKYCVSGDGARDVE